ncbi:DUF262 domain-containing protein [Massilia timonae]|uniref:DUF262 domain-containing protein n=1 Tax=Massilia timonae TaxID=47229 RepID=UPI0028A1B771|nr:DUF262 domain-containing protein [Massilia timonae]
MNAISEQRTNVSVEVKGFEDLGELVYPLKLDHYQRPYVWGTKKVEQLLADLGEFSARGDEHDYYLGTLLLHRDDVKKASFVIDGQQRLSSLAVLFHALHGRLPDGLDFHYRSPLSVGNLRQAQQVVNESMPRSIGKSIFSRLRFTVITVAREDLAFTFFDTQNNRGVPLKATDLLKAYHLRAINGADNAQVERLQQYCARRWENVQASGSRRHDGRRDFAPELFQRYLWRARSWCGQKRLEREDHDAILGTFQERSVPAEEIDSLPLYPGISNQFATRLCLQRGDDYRLDVTPVQMSASAAGFPFSLRQPIHRGVGFFLYAQKYAEMLEELFHDAEPDEGIERFREFYRSVVDINSHYLRELFNLALLMYVDRFGYKCLLEFAQRAELVLGGLRLAKQYIFKEAPLKYLRDADHNLLDVIAGAYRPEEIMEFLKHALSKSEGYGPKRIAEVCEDKGVRGRYWQAVQKYYRQGKYLPAETARYLGGLTLNGH